MGEERYKYKEKVLVINMILASVSYMLPIELTFEDDTLPGFREASPPHLYLARIISGIGTWPISW